MTFYTTDRNLAHIAKMLPPEGMTLWCDVANESSDNGYDHNGSVRAAWDAVNKEYRKKGHRYVRKDDPTSADVHVDTPLGTKKPKKKKPNLAIDDEAGGDVEQEQVDQVRVAYTTNKILKVDDTLGLVLGWAIVCKENGEHYFDTQGDNISEDAMLKAAAEFMQNSRVGGIMHKQNEDGETVQGGDILFCFPMTEDIAKAMGVETATTGLMVGYKPNDDETLAKFKSGEYTGFSIGGFRGEDEIVAD